MGLQRRVLTQAERSTMQAARTPLLLLVGLLGGAMASFVAWRLMQRQFRRALFNRRPLQRLAALGYLRAHPSVDSARLLRDYLQWERHPRLRRRARLALGEMERMLRSQE